MNADPPTYNSIASAQTSMPRSDADEEAIVFVEAVVRDTHPSDTYATAYLYQRNGSIYHAHKKRGCFGSRDNRVQLVPIKKDIGYEALIDQIITGRCTEQNLDLVAGGWKTSKVEVSGLRVVWEDLREGDRKFETWLNGSSDAHFQVILKKMAQRGWKDRLVIHFRAVG